MVQGKSVTRAKQIATVLMVAACVCLAGASEAAAPLKPAAAGERVRAEPRGRVYLFRGLIGLIDWGMDQLAQRINRTGVAAHIGSHMSWRSVANQAIADYRRDPRPITAIGHSIGGDAAVEFAEALAAAHVPVSLLITYDPTRMAHRVPANVQRYINLYQSSNFLGGGDLAGGRGFHGHYASYNLKDHPEVIHINLDKFEHIQRQLLGKIRTLAATPTRGEGEAVPLRILIPASAAIDLWDSGTPVTAHAGDTLQTIAAQHRVPLWAVAQLNRSVGHRPLAAGERVIVPRYLVPMGAGKRSSNAAPTR